MFTTDALPIPQDTANLGEGPDLHPACLPLRPIVGVWRGKGEVTYPTIDGPFRFEQQLAISHDGRPFLLHEARAWLVGDNGEVLRPAARETGWWRPQPGAGVELLLTHATGLLELFYGTATDQTSWELATDSVLCSASAKEVNAAQRTYELTSAGELTYTERRAMAGQPLTLHVTAEFHRTRQG